ERCVNPGRDPPDCGIVGRFLANDMGGAPLGRTNYVAVAGARGYALDDGWGDYNGVGRFFDRWVGVAYNRSKITLGNVSTGDGTSNTLILGEALGGNSFNRDFAFSWMGCGALLTLWGMPQSTDPGAEGWFNFSSRHSGVVQFCFADGSVRSLKRGSSG